MNLQFVKKMDVLDKITATTKLDFDFAQKN